jgi:uncharacterized protein (TIGR03083 family)
MGNLHPRVALSAVEDAYVELSRFASGLDLADLMRPSRCVGWTVADVLFHVLLDAQRALVTLATPAGKPADSDHVSYWRTWATERNENAAAAHARFVRVGAAAYQDPRTVVAHWNETAGAALRLAAQAPGADVVATQGHSFTVADFLSTLAVEATVHHLDMTVALPGRPVPRPGPVAHTVDVLDALLGEVRERPAWDDLTWILKGTGRVPLTATERQGLGTTASRFPLVG